MKTLLTLFLLLITSTAHAVTPPVQILHPRSRNPRGLWAQVVKPFHRVGIHPRLIRTKGIRMYRAKTFGPNLFDQYSALIREHALPGVRTILLVPPLRDDLDRDVSTGTGPIRGNWVICSWHFSEYYSVPCLAHQLGHSFGAQDRVEGLMNPIAFGRRSFYPSDGAEMRAVLREEGW